MIILDASPKISNSNNNNKTKNSNDKKKNKQQTLQIMVIKRICFRTFSNSNSSSACNKSGNSSSN